MGNIVFNVAITTQELDSLYDTLQLLQKRITIQG